jgi:hypothetical protein
VLTLNKQDVAKRHIEVAIRLWSESEDPTCVVTLAGAAEEVLGNMISRGDEPNMMARMIDMARERGWNATNRTIYRHVNRVRNALKHAGDSEEDEFEFDPEEGRAMILRAMVNYQTVTGALSPIMEAFLEDKVRGTFWTDGS